MKFRFLLMMLAIAGLFATASCSKDDDTKKDDSSVVNNNSNNDDSSNTGNDDSSNTGNDDTGNTGGTENDDPIAYEVEGVYVGTVNVTYSGLTVASEDATVEIIATGNNAADLTLSGFSIAALSASVDDIELSDVTITYDYDEDYYSISSSTTRVTGIVHYGDVTYPAMVGISGTIDVSDNMDVTFSVTITDLNVTVSAQFTGTLDEDYDEADGDAGED